MRPVCEVGYWMEHIVHSTYNKEIYKKLRIEKYFYCYTHFKCRNQKGYERKAIFEIENRIESSVYITIHRLRVYK